MVRTRGVCKDRVYIVHLWKNHLTIKINDGLCTKRARMQFVDNLGPDQRAHL